MNSKYDEELTSFIGNAEKNLIQATEPTKCVMISEENWKSIVKTLEAQLKAMDRLGEITKELPSTDQLMSFIQQTMDINLIHQKKWMTDLEGFSTKMMTDLTSQAGKMSEQSATDLAKIKMEMQAYSDRLYHRLLLPCLLTTLLSAVLTLWLVLQL